MNYTNIRISAVTVVSEIILMIGKLLIVVSSTIGAYFYLDRYYDDKLRGLHTVTSLVFFTSFISAELFNQIFAAAISTIIQCFVTDKELSEVSLVSIADPSFFPILTMSQSHIFNAAAYQ